jgi:PST family polysaccharide transporter
MSRNRIFKNIFSLGFIQIANYLLPFVTIPYVVRIIGPERLGIINLAQALVVYLIIIVNFGFDYTATRDISINRNNKTAINEIFSSTLFAKLLLFIITIIIFFILINLNAYKEHSYIIFYAYIAVFANVLFPTWYFQGSEQLTKTAIVYFLSRLTTLIFTFILIKIPSDYPLYPLISSVGQLFFTALALLYAIKSSGLSLTLPNISLIKKTFVDGFTIFLSSIVTNVYLMGSIIILDLYSSNEAVGYFSAASKIIVIFQSIILYPISQSLFPHLSRLFNDSIEKGLSVLKKMLYLVFGVTTFSSIIIFFFARLIILIVYGDKFLGAIICLKIISVLLVVTGISNVLGVQGLVNLKQDMRYLVITGIGALLSIILNMFLASKYNEIGTSIAWVITELTVMIGFIYSFKKLNLKFLRF